MSAVLGRVILLFILCFGFLFTVSFQWNAVNIPLNSRIESKLEHKLRIDFPSEFTAVDCVVSCFPILSRTRHAIDLQLEHKDFKQLVDDLNVSGSSGIVHVWNGCDRASGIMLSAFVEVEKLRFFYDHGTLTRGEQC